METISRRDFLDYAAGIQLRLARSDSILHRPIISFVIRILFPGIQIHTYLLHSEQGVYISALLLATVTSTVTSFIILTSTETSTVTSILTSVSTTTTTQTIQPILPIETRTSSGSGISTEVTISGSDGSSRVITTDSAGNYLFVAGVLTEGVTYTESATINSAPLSAAVTLGETLR